MMKNLFDLEESETSSVKNLVEHYRNQNERFDDGKNNQRIPEALAFFSRE
jgi:hypothetical protein